MTDPGNFLISGQLTRSAIKELFETAGIPCRLEGKALVIIDSIPYHLWLGRCREQIVFGARMPLLKTSLADNGRIADEINAAQTFVEVTVFPETDSFLFTYCLGTEDGVRGKCILQTWGFFEIMVAKILELLFAEHKRLVDAQDEASGDEGEIPF